MFEIEEEDIIEQKKAKLKRAQCGILFAICCLMLAIGPNFAWLFFSKYLQTYLYYQMDHAVDEESKSIEVWLYFTMLFTSVFFTPFAAACYYKFSIKLVLCFSLICVLLGSLSFIVCSSVWIWVLI